MSFGKSFFPFTIAMALLTGCSTGFDSGGGSSAPGGSGTSTSTPAGGVSTSTTTSTTGYNSNLLYLNLVYPDKSQIVVHRDGTDWSQKCTYQTGDPTADVVCFAEMEELDMYYTPTLQFQYNAPAGMCAFAEWMPYYYWRWEPGVGPSAEVILTIDSAGGTTLSGATSGVNTTITVVNGQPVCDKNYTAIGGPNCCLGPQNVETRTFDTTTGGYDISFASGSWGLITDLSKCLAGAAMDLQTLDANGYPYSTLYNLSNGANLNVSTSTLKTPLDQHFATNLYLTNFYVSTDGSYTLAQAPAAVQGPGGGVPSTYPYYSLYCYDHARETVARIRLFLRSWSTDSEFAKQAAGNWALSGTEPPPFSQFQLWDYITWGSISPANMMTTYPHTAGVEGIEQ